MKKVFLKRKAVNQSIVAVKIVLRRKLQTAVQLLTDEEIELASIAASYYALVIPTFEDGYEWKGVLEDTEWLAERGHKMINGPYAWLNEEDFTKADLAEYFELKKAEPSAS